MMKKFCAILAILCLAVLPVTAQPTSADFESVPFFVDDFNAGGSPAPVGEWIQDPDLAAALTPDPDPPQFVGATPAGLAAYYGTFQPVENNPSGDSAVMLVGNPSSTASSLFGLNYPTLIDPVAGSGGTGFANLQDYRLEAWVFMLGSNQSATAARFQGGLYVHTGAGPDLFYAGVFHNNGATGGGPGFGARGVAGGTQLYPGTAAIADGRWIKMAMMIIGDDIATVVDANNDGVLDESDPAEYQTWTRDADPEDFGPPAVWTVGDISSDIAPMFVDDVQIFAVRQAASAGSPVIDGSEDASLYGSPLAVQTTQTQFGDANGNLLGGGGSELDALHITNDASNIYFMVTGNLEANGNTLYLFIDDTTNATGVTGALPILTSIDDLFAAAGAAGTTLPDGFDVDFGFVMKGFDNPTAGGSGTYDIVYGVANYRTSTADPATNPGADITSNDTTNPATITDSGFTSLGTFQFGVDNSNTAGVIGGTAAADQAAAAAVTTGIEIGIPLSAIGSPAPGTDLCVFAGVNNGGGSFWANQFLPGLPTPAGNLGEDPNLSSAGVNLSCATYTVLGAAAGAQSWSLYE